ncbi:MAG: aspartate carbamoyltransferase [Candidatus Pacebacteria bacterium]|nr:aspartate carbamoyltransferase [Candidatus Paceibacterota bacterium]
MPSAENPYYKKSLISVDDIKERQMLELLLEEAKKMGIHRQAKEALEYLKGHGVSLLFYQPSTRTNSSFHQAAQFLGASVYNPGSMQYSSVSKGENLPDTIRSIANTTDASLIVLRHPDDNSSRTADKFAKMVKPEPVPIINAGSGTLEHPTQALLDLMTIYSKMQTIDELKIALVGDLLYGRTVKSLAMLMARLTTGNEFAFVSPDQQKFPQEYLDKLPEGTSYTETEDLDSILDWADVVYMTRTQKEWFEAHGQMDEYEKLASAMQMTTERADEMHDGSIVMHPLPRQTELRYGVDSDPKAAYFEQMRFGLWTRMALMKLMLVEDPSA